MKETSCLEYDCNELQMYILLDIEPGLEELFLHILFLPQPFLRTCLTHTECRIGISFIQKCSLNS